jgi:hypothetical protein
MKTLLIVAFVATFSLAAGKMPGFGRPDPPEKAFIVGIGAENRITIGEAVLTDAQAEAVLKVFVAATISPAIVIQIKDIDAPGARRNHMMEMFERIRARSQPFDFWFVYSAEAKTQLEQRRKAQQAGTGQPATRPESKSEGSDKPQPESEGRSR